MYKLQYCKKQTNNETGQAFYHIMCVDNDPKSAGEQFKSITVPVTDKNTEYVNKAIAYAQGKEDDGISADELVARLTDGETLFDAAEDITHDIQKKLSHVTTHLTTDGDHVYIDNDTFEHAGIDTVLEDHLVRLMTSDDADDERAFRSFAAFTENLYSNNDPEIRGGIGRWLKAQNMLTFTEDGALVGYKGCSVDDNGVAVSVHAGPGIVDGERMNGHLPNKVGSVIEMPRSDVEHNSRVGCASGLHVGTYDYAYNWSEGSLLKVKVYPQDIVSVPFECSDQKIRCCRYEVLEDERIDKSYGREPGYEFPTYYREIDSDQKRPRGNGIAVLGLGDRLTDALADAGFTTVEDILLEGKREYWNGERLDADNLSWLRLCCNDGIDWDNGINQNDTSDIASAIHEYVEREYGKYTLEDLGIRDDTIDRCEYEGLGCASDLITGGVMEDRDYLAPIDAGRCIEAITDLLKTHRYDDGDDAPEHVDAGDASFDCGAACNQPASGDTSQGAIIHRLAQQYGKPELDRLYGQDQTPFSRAVHAYCQGA